MIKSLRIIIAFILILFPSILIKAEIRISIPAEVEVSSSPVSLGDIAQIENIDENDLLELSSIELITSLLPGYSRVLYRNHVSLLLRNKYRNTEIDLDMPDAVNISRSKRILDHDYLYAEASDFILSKIDYQEEQVEIIPRFMPPEIILPDRDFDLEFQLSSSNNLIGNISLQAKILVDRVLSRQFYMGFQVRVFEKVYLAKRPIEVGERINKEDFYQVYQGLISFQGDIIKDFNNSLIKDGVVSRAIPRDGVLTTYHLTLPIIIRPADILQAEIISGGIRVRTQVIARQSGRKGDYITVENINTRHRFKAEIISSHLVRLVFTEEG